MSPEAWTFFSVISAGVLGLFNETRNTRRKVEQVHEDVGVAAGNATVAAEAAGQAAEMAKPMGNGFAASVLKSLESLKEGQRILHHEIGEVREDLSDHKDMHISEGMQKKRERN